MYHLTLPFLGLQICLFVCLFFISDQYHIRVLSFGIIIFFYNFMFPDISFATCPPVPVEIIMAQGVSIFQGEQYSNRCPCCFSAAVSCLSSRCHTVFVTTVVTINFWCWNVISIKHAQPVSAFLCMLCYIRYDRTLVTLRKK